MEASPQSPVEAPTIAFHHRVIVASVLAGLAIIGLFGNALVIFSVITTKKLRTVTNVLVVNLAVADILTCSSLPFQMAGLLRQTARYPIPEIICAIVAGVGFTSVCCSASTLVAIGFVRWYVITRSIRGHQGSQRELRNPACHSLATVYGYMILMANSVVNPIIYGLKHPNFQEGFKRILCRRRRPLERVSN
eukprot:XP_011679138.1 PREDICTED: delta-type opioid receptor-like [Strongylocentrotus purpuratus]